MNELEKSTGVTNALLLIDKAIEKGMPIEQLSRLFDLQERWEKNRAAEAWAEAVKEFQAAMPAIVKGESVKDRSGNQMYKFASYDDVLSVAQPILKECGITVTFDTSILNGQITTVCHVRVGTHVENTSVTLGLPAIPNANEAQRAGAALAYGKRYALVAALNINIKGEDTDAQNLDLAITPEQVQEIADVLRECEQLGKKVDHVRFLSWLNVQAIEQLPQKDFVKAIHELNRKRRNGGGK